MRGRKRQENSKTKVISLRITEEQHELISKNDWIKKELVKQVEAYLNTFVGRQ